MSDRRRVRAEIEARHAFFEGWFNGRLPQRRDRLEEDLLSHFDESFVLITPDGETLTKPALGDMFWRGHGQSEGFAITIGEVTLRQRIGEVVVATYEEQQVGARNVSRPSNARISSVVFRDDGESLSWLHVHETWLE